MLTSVHTIPHAQKTRVLDEPGLLSQPKVHHLQVNTNVPLILIKRIFSSRYFTASYFSFSVVEWARGTEANRFPLCSRTHFSDRLLLSMNSLQSSGCAEVVQYPYNTPSPSLHRKNGGTVLFISVAVEGDASTVREGVLFLKFGKKEWIIIVKNHFLFILFNTRGAFLTNVRKFSKDRYWNFIAMSYYLTMCWLKIRILEAAPVLSVDPSQINNAEVAVRAMVCRLPPNHGNSKLQTTLIAIGPTT